MCRVGRKTLLNSTQLIAKLLPSFRKSVAESNGNVRISTESSQMTVCAHAQYKFGQEELRTTGATPIDRRNIGTV